MLPHAHVDPGAYALIGMGAFFAAFLRCPVSAVLIVFETTGDYGLVLPVMLAVAIATSLSRRIAPHSLTELQMHEEGFREPVEANDPLAGLTAADVMSAAIVTVRADLSMLDAARRISGTRHRAYPVVNEDGKLLGVLPSTAIDVAAQSGTMDEPIAAHVQPNVDRRQRRGRHARPDPPPGARQHRSLPGHRRRRPRRRIHQPGRHPPHAAAHVLTPSAARRRARRTRSRSRAGCRG